MAFISTVLMPTHPVFSRSNIFGRPTPYNLICLQRVTHYRIMFIKSIIRYALSKAASNPKVRQQATKSAREFAKGAGKLARDPDPARRLGRMAGRLKKKIQNRDF